MRILGLALKYSKCDFLRKKISQIDLEPKKHNIIKSSILSGTFNG